MSDKLKPVWVESLMNRDEWKTCYKTYGGSLPEPLEYDPNYYKGGRWRYGMGSTPTPTEMDKRNREIDSLREFHLLNPQLV